METLKFKVLYLGRSEHEKHKLVRTEDLTEQIKSPRFAVLVQHPDKGNILIDTGDSRNMNEIHSVEIDELYPTMEFIPIDQALEKEGLQLDDIDQIIITHLHYDHVGGLPDFIGKKAAKNVIVSEPEARDVFYQTIVDPAKLSHAYIPALYAGLEGVSYYPIKNVYEYADGISLFVQNAHTAGVIGIILRLQGGGSAIFSSDTLYTRDSFYKGLPPTGALFNSDDEFFEQLNAIKKIKDTENGEILFGHDYEQVKKLETLGWISNISQIRGL